MHATTPFELTNSLSDQALEQIRASGDHWVRPLVTARMLRALLALQVEEQIYEIENFLRNRRKPEKNNGDRRQARQPGSTELAKKN